LLPFPFQVQLVNYADNPQQERQQVVFIVPFAVGDLGCNVVLRPQAKDRPVYKFDSGDPVPFGNSAISLDIVLPAGEIPHEITPVHKINLVVKQEFQVVEQRGFFTSIGNAAPNLIPLNVVAVSRFRRVGMHARKEHGVGVLVCGYLGFYVPVFLVFGRLQYPAVRFFLF